MSHAFLNKNQLVKLLTITDPKRESIYGIIGRMEVLLDYFEKQKNLHGLIPFLKTYYFVTKASVEKYLSFRHYFWSIEEYEALDVYFASLYFKPLLGFLTEGKNTSPWKLYLDYCEKPKGIPFLQMLLGVNAHINTDLYSAIMHLRYKNKSDFFLVNAILQEVTPDVMQFLALSKHDILGITGFFMKDFVMKEFQLVIARWRKEAWENAQNTTPSFELTYKKITQQTEQVAEKLIDEFIQLHTLSNLPQFIGRTHQIIAHIHTLSVKTV